MAGIKHDQEKPDMTLVPRALKAAVATVMGFGAKKYGRDNWRLGMAKERVLAAAMRHLDALCEGEETDPESGLSHAAHAATNIGFYLHYLETEKKFDGSLEK